MTDGIYLLLGTNLGDKNSNLIKAKKAINTTIGALLRESSVYETDAWGKIDQASFLNQVIEISTEMSPELLLSAVNLVESKLGRVRTEKWGERVIDIDILYYQNLTVATPDLIIPHPGIFERRFTLEPLAEIAPNFIHPILNLSNVELLQKCSDPLEVKKLT